MDQIVLGDYTDSFTLLGTAGQITFGFTGLDVPMDIRDISNALVNGDNSFKHVSYTAFLLICLLPFIGALKPGSKLFDALKPHLEKIPELVEKLKQSDNTIINGLKNTWGGAGMVADKALEKAKGFWGKMKDGIEKIGNKFLGKSIIKKINTIKAEEANADWPRYDNPIPYSKGSKVEVLRIEEVTPELENKWVRVYGNEKSKNSVWIMERKDIPYKSDGTIDIKKLNLITGRKADQEIGGILQFKPKKGDIIYQGKVNEGVDSNVFQYEIKVPDWIYKIKDRDEQHKAIFDFFEIRNSFIDDNFLQNLIK